MKSQDLKKIILKLSREGEFYGYEIHKRLSTKRINVEISRLYRILNEMLKDHLLTSHWEKSRFGPRKRMYRIGEKGKEELDRLFLDAIKTVHEYYKEYLLNLPPEVNVFDKICSMCINKSKGVGNVAFVTSKYTVMHERLIHALHDRVPQWRIYLVNPGSEGANLNLDKLTTLEGTYNNVPLKDNYVNFLIATVTDILPEDFLKTILTEWRRVLKQKGRLGILIPTVLIHKYEDPLTIGDFIEKFEHGTKEKSEHLDAKSLKRLLQNFFQNVETKKIVHLTIFSALEPL